ncbi:MAG: hypothetical protein JXD22_13900 [Sedimentisphaerales bacterium]|nr:hypothetical protein [Sedimentisphaerales bacterium]
MSDNEDKLILLLNDYLDGQLDPAQAEKVEQLLTEDPQVREILSRLRQGSQAVHNLPMVAAPSDLADQIAAQMERDLLLGSSELLNEQIGRKHLFLRRFIAAAAILILVGAVAAITYNVLFENPDQATKTNPIIALAPPEKTQETNKSSTEIIRDTPPDIVLAEKKSDTLALPKYGKIHLRLSSPDLDDYTAQLEAALTEQQIHKVIRNHTDPANISFAFLCSPNQLTEIVRKFENQSSCQLSLVIPDDQGNKPIVISHSSSEQLLKLASLTDGPEKADLARQIRQQQNLTPNLDSETLDWWDKVAIVDSISDIHLLGEDEMQDANSPSPFSANTPSDKFVDTDFETDDKNKNIEAESAVEAAVDTAPQVAEVAQSEPTLPALIAVEIFLTDPVATLIDDPTVPDTNSPTTPAHLITTEPDPNASR